MFYLSDTALEVLEILMLNGLQLDDIKNSMDLQAIVQNIYEDNIC